MDRMLYIGMSGAKETMLAQAATANNLANATTTGFRADLSQARSMPVFGPGHPSRAFAQSERPGYDLTPASLQTTGRDLDVAIQGEGWLGVLDAQGNEAYTRRGDLQRTVNGILVNGAGQPVLGNGGPVALPPAESIAIAAVGIISIRPVGSDPNTLVQIDRLKLVNPPGQQMEKGEDGLFRRRGDLGPAEADAFVRVVPGALESSNVNAVESMVDMINHARKFEMQVKVMQTAQQVDDRTTELLRMS